MKILIGLLSILALTSALRIKDTLSTSAGISPTALLSSEEQAKTAVESINPAKTNINAEIAALEIEIATLKSEATKLELEMASYSTDDIILMQQDIANRNKEIEELKAEVVDKQAALDQIKKFTAEDEAALPAIDDKKKELKELSDKQASAAKQMEEQLAKNKAELALLKDNLEKATASYLELKQELKVKQDERANAEIKLKSDIELAQGEDQKKAEEESTKEAEDKALDPEREAVAKLVNEIVNDQKNSNEKLQQLVEVARNLNDLKAQLQDAAAKLSNVNMDILAQTEIIKTAQKGLQDLKKKFAGDKSVYSAARANLDSDTVEYNLKLKHIAQLEASATEKQKKIQDRKQQFITESKLLDEQEIALEKESVEAGAIQANRNDILAEAEKADNSLLNAAKEVGEMETNLNSMTVKLALAEKAYDAKLKDIQERKTAKLNAKSTLENKLKQLNDDLDALKTQEGELINSKKDEIVNRDQIRQHIVDAKKDRFALVGDSEAKQKRIDELSVMDPEKYYEQWVKDKIIIEEN